MAATQLGRLRFMPGGIAGVTPDLPLGALSMPPGIFPPPSAKARQRAPYALGRFSHTRCRLSLRRLARFRRSLFSKTATQWREKASN
jgi:hypothetical protein